MVNKIIRSLITVLTLLMLNISALAEYTLRMENTLSINAGTGNFAPYYIASDRYGTLTQATAIQDILKIWRPTDYSKRFGYGYGIEILANWNKATGYSRCLSKDEWFIRNIHAPYFSLTQLWGEIRWRSLFLLVGMKNNNRSVFDSPLYSGDLTLSDNARPIPQIRLGFNDFQEIPFTNGWVQIQGEIAYGKTTDKNWIEDHFNRYNSYITTGWWFHYKRCYFRTKPSKPFSFMIGMQTSAQFGGYYQRFEEGSLRSAYKEKVNFMSFVNIFAQKGFSGNGNNTGDQAYYYGNSLGSWDVKMRYRFRDESELTLSIQSPWEDGSGIGKFNGWDGVYSLEYRFNRPGVLEAVNVEYLDFRNQSGPIPWEPNDRPGTAITARATGGDNYYNNFMYNGWAYYGMSLGTPFLVAPIYNTTGRMIFLHNRVHGCQIGAMGHLPQGLQWRMLFSWRESLGNPFIPLTEKMYDTSLLLEGVYSFSTISGLSLKAQFAFDAGKLYGTNVGVLVALTYTGDLTFSHKSCRIKGISPYSD